MLFLFRPATVVSLDLGRAAQQRQVQSAMDVDGEDENDSVKSRSEASSHGDSGCGQVSSQRYKQQLQECRVKIADYEKALAERDSAIRELSEQLNASLSAQEEEERDVSEQVDSISAEVSHLKTLLGRSRSEAEEWKLKVHVQEAKMQELTKHVEELQSSHSSLKAAIHLKEEEITIVKTEKDHQIQELMSLAHKAQKKLLAEDGELVPRDRHQQAMNSLRDELEKKCISQVASVRQQLSVQYEKKLETMKGEKETLLRDLREAHGALQASKDFDSSGEKRQTNVDKER
ncbi:unnamed protein product [Darwinula stevensoni]|uniref:Uncharacterized protein n=1 Tax=Darwinula stevensoni TaxID=69355 RepID=A0A7R8XGD7_9CRUS|nr:unnamed protein product [Darwinula stevensoni]CAG0891383.1 unnamed protein product [Darwinula stevensoni]